MTVTQTQIKAQVAHLARLRELNGLPKDYSALYRAVYKSLDLLEDYEHYKATYNGAQSYLSVKFPK
jgi:hypothetical protein